MKIFFILFNHLLWGRIYSRLAAKNLNIKLIFYGDTNAEFGNPDDFNNSLKPLKYYTTKNSEELYISGIKYTELIERFKIPKQDLNNYLPLSEEEFVKSKIKVQYLDIIFLGILRIAIILQ